ncbi:Endonuclease, Uma2 family (restriction endonuclease fold) [Sulfurivirga caldicuralii]|uniref:Endonuclease, Uma2 family (Restriction endonuclease fold) n=1 Tax=Sulfurivirga caldicuralii TaxID=364032 RepID=A0A1N6H675_9GAMM|nr:Uma2 family endonuclease [Sulfurivirga caldicuralii]SIO15242.1 Endonuclease, Uma2 family (restriction endonuclease fold) [Sulfurivirga caldicuralii]
MPALPYLHYTVKDYEQWPGDWELIEGHPVAMSPAPTLAHQRLNFLIMMALENSLAACEACQAIPDAQWRIDSDTVLRPDGVVICYQPQQYLTRAPEVVVEIISPSTAAIDEHYKFERYAIEGVRHYLLVYGEEKRVRHYVRNQQGQFVLANDRPQGVLKLPLSQGCEAQIDWDEIFKSFSKVLSSAR